MPRRNKDWYDSDDLSDGWSDSVDDYDEDENEEEIEERNEREESRAMEIPKDDVSTTCAPTPWMSMNETKEHPEYDSAGGLARLLQRRARVSHPKEDWKSSRYPWTPSCTLGEGDEASEPFRDPSPDDLVLHSRQGRVGTSSTHKEARVRQQKGQGSIFRRRRDVPREKHNQMARSEEETKRKEQEEALLRIAKGEVLPKDWHESFLPKKGDLSTTNNQSLVHVAMLGHVDAGKSTLAGRLLHATGGADSRAFREAERAAQQKGDVTRTWAFLLDAREGERARGVTQDVAEARLSMHSNGRESNGNGGSFGQEKKMNASVDGSSSRALLLDAPGHGDFTPATIRAMARADAAVLVIDGTQGGYEAGMAVGGLSSAQGGRTREHAVLARSLGVEQMVVAVTKMDAWGYDQHRFECIREELGNFLRKCGFNMKKVQWVPVSGYKGDNVAESIQEEGLCGWYSGPTLLQAIQMFDVPERQLDAPFRMAVIETQDSVSRELATLLLKGSGRTSGCVARGKVDAGMLCVGSKIALMPVGVTCEVKAALVDGGKAEKIQAGDDVTLILEDIKPDVFGEGDLLCDWQFPVPVVTCFAARIRVLDIKMPILQGQELVLHTKTAHMQVTLSRLVSVLDPKTKGVLKSRPRCLTRNQTALVHIQCPKGICLERYADVRSLGRITLRDQGITLAVGIVSELVEPSLSMS